MLNTNVLYLFNYVLNCMLKITNRNRLIAVHVMSMRGRL